jgi:hypothetical protein
VGSHEFAFLSGYFLSSTSLLSSGFQIILELPSTPRRPEVSQMAAPELKYVELVN